jgi:hypothetical protein
MVWPNKVPAASRVIGGRSGTLFELIPQLPSRGRSCACGQRRARNNPSRPWTSLVNALVILDLAEGERVSLNARVEEGDLEGTLGNGARLADELVEPRFGDRAVALVVDVGPVRGARRLPLDAHAEPHGRPWRGRSHDQVQIPGVEAVDNPGRQDRPHPAAELEPSSSGAKSWFVPACHPRAISSGHKRYAADSYGHFERAVMLATCR